MSNFKPCSNWFVCCLALIILVLDVAHADAQSRIYVKKDAMPPHDGATWGTAFTDLQTALAAAEFGTEIWVAAGLYTPTTGADRDSFFLLKSGVKLFGGFKGTELFASERTVSDHPTILSGNIGNPSDSTDNSYTILYMPYPDTSTWVDGVVFEHAYADVVDNSMTFAKSQSGGAVYVEAENGKGMPNFSNCTFRHNYVLSFGAAYCAYVINTFGSVPTFKGCVFFNNRAGRRGGAVFVRGGSYSDRGIEFERCTFVKNTSNLEGGGIYWWIGFGENDLEFNNCSIRDHATGSGGVFLLLHRNDHNPCQLSIRNCSFMDNKSLNLFRDLIVLVGPVARQNKVVIEHSQFVGNRDFENLVALGNSSLIEMGDTISCIHNEFINNDSRSVFRASSNYGYIEVRGSTFENNGGNNQNTSTFPVDLAGTRLVLTNNLFKNNLRACSLRLISTPSAKASALVEQNVFIGNRISSSTNPPLGIFGLSTTSLMMAQTSDTVRFLNNVFAKNQTRDHSPNLAKKTVNILYNNIFLENRRVSDGSLQLPLRLGLDTFYLDHNFFDTPDMCANYPNFTCGANNMSGEMPIFQDLENGDIRLSPCSPLVDAGKNQVVQELTFDFAGLPRIQGNAVDIGAHEAPLFGYGALPIVRPSCDGGSNGSIALNVANGCLPYMCQWQPNLGDTLTPVGLAPGTYYVTISDGFGRQFADSILIPTAPIPQAGLQIQNFICGTQTGGSIYAEVMNGTPPFDYQWSFGSTAPYATSLVPGDYTLTLTDSWGCQSAWQASILLEGSLALSVSGTPISCPGMSDAVLTAIPTNGTEPFSWQWTGWQNNEPTIGPLGVGIYSVTVSDANGCSGSFSFNPVTDPPPITIGLASSPQSQSSPPNGAAVVTSISGGTGPYNYAWSTGGSGYFQAGLEAGTYSLTVTDARGCTGVAQVVVQSTVGATEIDPALGISFYPNPVGDFLNLYLPEEGWLVSISDATGRKLLEQKGDAGKNYIDFSNLPKGIYWLLLVAQGDQKKVAKLIVKQAL